MLGAALHVAALQPCSLIIGDLVGNVYSIPPPGPRHLAILAAALTGPAQASCRTADTRTALRVSSIYAPDSRPCASIPLERTGIPSPLQQAPPCQGQRFGGQRFKMVLLVLI